MAVRRRFGGANLERAPHPVAGRIFERGQDRQPILAVLPAVSRRERPLRLRGLHVDSACHPRTRRQRHDERTLQEGVVERPVECNHQRVARPDRGRRHPPRGRVDSTFVGRTDRERLAVRLDQRQPVGVGPGAIDHQRVAPSCHERPPQLLVRQEAALDATGVEQERVPRPVPAPHGDVERQERVVHDLPRRIQKADVVGAPCQPHRGGEMDVEPQLVLRNLGAGGIDARNARGGHALHRRMADGRRQRPPPPGLVRRGARRREPPGREHDPVLPARIERIAGTEPQRVAGDRVVAQHRRQLGDRRRTAGNRDAQQTLPLLRGQRRGPHRRQIGSGQANDVNLAGVAGTLRFDQQDPRPAGRVVASRERIAACPSAGQDHQRGGPDRYESTTTHRVHLGRVRPRVREAPRRRGSAAPAPTRAPGPVRVRRPADRAARRRRAP